MKKNIAIAVAILAVSAVVGTAVWIFWPLIWAALLIITPFLLLAAPFVGIPLGIAAIVIMVVMLSKNREDKI